MAPPFGKTISTPKSSTPKLGEPVADGEMGELVFTSLTKEALPIIRYRTRDLTRLLPGTARTMRRMEKITGRSDDMMIIRGVNVFPSQIEELILKRPELAPHYQCVLTREGPMDNLKVAVETRPGTRQTVQEARAAAKMLQHEIKVYIGSSVEIDLRAEGGVERSQGKAKRVLDLRTNHLKQKLNRYDKSLRHCQCSLGCNAALSALFEVPFSHALVRAWCADRSWCSSSAKYAHRRECSSPAQRLSDLG
jgi:hypothetical protein